jgi:lipopolysaccharide biosynthesis protein/GT2 family glycosyltransferase
VTRRANPIEAAPGLGEVASKNSVSTQVDLYARAIADSVDLIICVHNALNDVRACLASVSLLEHRNLRIIVVDDGSDAPTRDYIAEVAAKDSRYVVLRNDAALGYTRAANAGIRASLGDFLILLNSDTVVPANLVRQLLVHFHLFPDVGIVGPLSNAASWQSVPALYDANGEMAVNDLPPAVTLNEINDGLAKKWLYRPVFPRVQVLNGFCLAMRRRVVDRVGLFDERNFPEGYGEENDFCFRASDAGFGLMVATNAYVFHAKTRSYSRERRKALSDRAHARLVDLYSEARLKRAVHSAVMHPLLAHMRDAFEDMFVRKGARDAPLPSVELLSGAKPSASIAVVVHVYYPELWPEIAAALAKIPEPFDLFVSVTSGMSDTLAPAIERAFAGARVLVFPNRGRDLLPFLFYVRSGVLFHYAAVLKLHTKKSAHSADGAAWRRAALRDLVGDAGTVRRIVEMIRQPTGTGLVGPDGSRAGSDRWGANLDRTRLLLRALKEDVDEGSLEFVAGSMFWAHPFVLRLLLLLDVKLDAFEREMGQLDGTVAHALERALGIVAKTASMRILEVAEVRRQPVEALLPPSSRVKPVAFFLPQFHPTPENDAWWGKGFTEWRNVVRATPQYAGHDQPRLPADLGFYDLRLDVVREEQAALARAYGVHGFCYYYYWFNGRKVLNQPIEAILQSGKPDFPFCLCWANESWSRRWDGREDHLLLKQEYGPDFAERFIADVIPFLRDPRYIRHDGAPLLLVYRLGQIPAHRETVAIWREACSRAGIDRIHVAAVRVPKHFEFLDGPPQDHGVDSYVTFPPHLTRRTNIKAALPDVVAGFSGVIARYEEAISDDLGGHEHVAGPTFRGIMTAWDNTPRRGSAALIFDGATPARFRRWLQAILDQERAAGRQPEFLFVNAWNEWAEGAILEPDQRNGRAYLEALASVVGSGNPDSI